MKHISASKKAGGLATSIAISLAIGLTGCAQADSQCAPTSNSELPHASQISQSAEEGGSSVSVSRPYVYDSEQALADDCDTILIGTVITQDDAYDVDPLIPDTRAQVRVIQTRKGAAVAEEEVVVRQTGDLSLSLLENGETYLFYLNDVPSKAGEPKQYYITGVTAGLFKLTYPSKLSAQQIRQNEQNLNFTRVDKESGDQLPDTLSLEKTADKLSAETE